MRIMKKLVTLVLCVAIISSLCAFQIVVSAEETSVAEITEQDELLIEKLESFGIISNEYDPSGYATRREKCAKSARNVRKNCATVHKRTNK